MTSKNRYREAPAYGTSMTMGTGVQAECINHER
jgi:hypothetical protein